MTSEISETGSEQPVSEPSQSTAPKDSEAKPAEGQSSAPDAAKKPAKNPAKKAKKKSAKKPKPEEGAEAGKDTPKSGDDKSDQGKESESKDPEAKGGSRRRRSRGGSSRSPKTPSKHDPEQLAKHAWKIYLAEISEEGVTMIDDSAAKGLARRCFDLASVFLDEQERQS